MPASREAIICPMSRLNPSSTCGRVSRHAATDVAPRRTDLGANSTVNPKPNGRYQARNSGRRASRSRAVRRHPALDVKPQRAPKARVNALNDSLGCFRRTAGSKGRQPHDRADHREMVALAGLELWRLRSVGGRDDRWRLTRDGARSGARERRRRLTADRFRSGSAASARVAASS